MVRLAVTGARARQLFLIFVFCGPPSSCRRPRDPAGNLLPLWPPDRGAAPFFRRAVCRPAFARSVIVAGFSPRHHTRTSAAGRAAKTFPPARDTIDYRRRSARAVPLQVFPTEVVFICRTETPRGNARAPRPSPKANVYAVFAVETSVSMAIMPELYMGDLYDVSNHPGCCS